jgi:hypothetical protein
MNPGLAIPKNANLQIYPYTVEKHRPVQNMGNKSGS